MSTGFTYEPGLRKGKPLYLCLLNKRWGEKDILGHCLNIIGGIKIDTLFEPNKDGDSAVDMAVSTGNVALLSSVQQLLQQATIEAKVKVASLLRAKKANGHTLLLSAIRPNSFGSLPNISVVRIHRFQ